MKKNLLVLICLGSCVGAGCDSGPPPRWQRAQEAMDIVRPQVELANMMMQAYRDTGLAALTVNPPGAKLYIDGGEYVDTKDEIMLPIGPHRFSAVWPDGAQVTREIYVVTAVTDMELNIDLSGDNINWRTQRPEMHKTPVILTKPE